MLGHARVSQSVRVHRSGVRFRAQASSCGKPPGQIKRKRDASGAAKQDFQQVTV